MSHERDRPLPLETRAELSRREALKLLAGALAAAQAACIEPPGDRVQPYARQPAELTPGTPRWFATSMLLEGFATGLLVESHEGRPTKVEGNPDHPASLGGTLAQHQASVLDLYDPARARGVTHGGAPSSWRALSQQLQEAPDPWWLVLPDSSSLVERALLASLLAKRPKTKLVRDTVHPRHEGAQLAFGSVLEAQYDFREAQVVLSLDAELFAQRPMAPRWARDFALRRRSHPAALRSYAVEPMLSATGSLADHRLALRAGDVFAFTLALSEALRARGLSLPALPAVTLPEAQRAFLAALADDLVQHRGASIIACGDRQPAACHALTYALNRALENRGVQWRECALNTSNASLEELRAALEQERVGALIILDCNPAYATSLKLGNAKLSVHVDRYYNETSALCRWHAPLSHYLESWDLAHAQDGTLSIVQPLLRPLYDSRSTNEVYALLNGDLSSRGYDLARAAIQRDEARWEQLLTQGWEATTLPTVTPALRELKLELAPPRALELDLGPSPTILSERFANNAWLQELPHPRSKQAWGNALLMPPKLAAKLGIDEGAVVRVARAGRAIELPAFVVREHAEDAVTLELGYGRTGRDERVAYKLGANAEALCDQPGQRILGDVTLTRTGRRDPLARTQNELDQHGRELAPVLSLAALSSDPLAELRKVRETTLPPTRHEAPQWAMTIDTDLCSGCNACVIACQSENNIPVVGKRELARGREMHWLRIDTYVTPQGVVNQPMMCQHCEHAPCEYVCPVFATEHSPDGLNEMSYQRCIGTRFCQANCPYKVRRFNWLHYSADDGALALQKNPEVTVRDRGVMEKCTYCVQRIRHAEYNARMQKRAIRQGEVVSACQQACPTNAIQFGMLPMPDRASTRAYGVLSELGTRPRTMYLAKLQNANPALEERS